MYTNPYEQCVGDVMTKTVVSAKASETLHDALMLMEDNDVTSLPIVDRFERCVGIVSASDVLELTREIEGELGDMERLGDDSPLGLADFAYRHPMGQERVRELMSSNVATISPEARLTEAADRMLKRQVHHLPVVDEENRVVGIVSTMDILRAFAEGAPA